MSRTTPRKGRARVDFVDVDRPSKVERSVSTPQTTNTKHPRQDEYLQSDKRPVFRAPQRHTNVRKIWRRLRLSRLKLARC